MHPSLLALLLGSAPVLLASAAFAHGGSYLPPPAAPTPAGPTPGLGSTPGGAGPGGAPGPNTPGATQPTDFSTWTWWWQLQKEPYLDLKERVQSGGASTGGEGFFLGRGYRHPERSAPGAPTPEEVHQRIVPALLAVVQKEGEHVDVLTAALIALAKVGPQDPEREAEIESVLRAGLGDRNQEVAETAAVALGVLGLPRSAGMLGDLLLDTDDGRKAVGGREVPWRTRAFAAYGLGVLGAQTENVDVRRFVVHRLARGLEGDRAPVPDVQVACVIALGRVPLPPDGNGPDEEEALASRSRESQIRVLQDVLADTARDRMVRAHAPVSLGILIASDPSLHGSPLEREIALDMIGRLAVGSHDPRELQQSCAMALGLLGDDDADELDEKIRHALVQVAKSASDSIERDFAQLSLARVAARRGEGDSVGLKDVRKFLLQSIGRGSSGTARWGGIAAALLERWVAERGGDVSKDVVAALRTSLDQSSAPLDVGAFAIAAGLARDGGAAGTLLKKLDKVSQEETRGYVAVALGMSGVQDALEPIRAIVAGSTYRPLLLRDAATALGLLGDSGAVSLLIDQLERASSQAAQASIAQALGRIGDRRAIEPLLALVEKPDTTIGARAFAIVALGAVADRRPLPWTSILSVGVNYAAAPPTLFDDKGLGVLNIL